MNDNQSICDDDLIFDQVDLCERDEINELLGKIQGLSRDPKLLELVTQLVNIVVKQSKEIKNLKAINRNSSKGSYKIRTKFTMYPKE